MEPESSLSERYNVVKFLKLPMKGGIGPVRLYKVVKFLKLPMEGGIGLVRFCIREGFQEPTEGVVLTDAQKTKLEGLKLKDLKAKNYLFRDIDHSILETILCKDTAKHIWDSMKKKYQGTTRAKRQQLQALRSEFEMLRMTSGELVIDYFSRTIAIVNKIRIHGDKTENVLIVEKILRSLTPNFNFIVCSIEEANDVGLLSIDELQIELIEEEEEAEVGVEEAEITMIVGTNNKIIVIKRVNFREEAEDVEATT
ncbi:hypothetical protein CK203_050879 [Vitis vinifera]|uniref:Retrovirus-related Pol polyprotein from transposon TNT 1-94 n=1 Tax=Vitis vinifera TaxID=29760 RepID=A0A438GQX7_VITVI|nr:hypothetical protein CK203_050879 [Vitis vinifera]